MIMGLHEHSMTAQRGLAIREPPISGEEIPYAGEVLRLLADGEIEPKPAGRRLHGQMGLIQFAKHGGDHSRLIQLFPQGLRSIGGIQHGGQFGDP